MVLRCLRTRVKGEKPILTMGEPTGYVGIGLELSLSKFRQDVTDRNKLDPSHHKSEG